MPESGIEKFQNWLINETWEDVYQSESAHEKASIFQNKILKMYEDIFPLKTRKVSSDDAPWISHKLKTMLRKRKRIYRRQRKSDKWTHMNKLCKEEIKSAKATFYKDQVADLKSKKPHQWYSSLKKLCSYDQHKTEPLQVDEISHLSDQEQAERIADQVTQIPNEFEPLQKDDISIPLFLKTTSPSSHPV